MSRLDTMLTEVRAASRRPVAERPQLVAAALAAHVADPALLGSRCCDPDPACYTRHLLSDDPEGGYAVAAIVWCPGQMSRIHSHLTWCALAVHAGVLTETFYTLHEEGRPASVEPAACVLRRPGDISHGVPGAATVHRMANLGSCVAVSIHVYGAAFAQFATAVNRILDA